jgi:hypothetical protein
MPKEILKDQEEEDIRHPRIYALCRFFFRPAERKGTYKRRKNHTAAGYSYSAA